MARSAILFPAFTIDPTLMTIANSWTPLKTLTDLLALGVFQRNIYVGGGQGDEASRAALSAGTFDVEPWLPLGIDNRNTSQISTFLATNGGTLKVQWRFLLRVSQSTINITPVIYNITTASNATISGAVACSATNSDYSGSNQQQTITLTLPTNALNYFRPRVIVGGSPGAGSPALEWWATVAADLFIET